MSIAIPRSKWTYRKASLTNIGRTALLFIHHTVGPQGDGSLASEKRIMRETEAFHINTNGWSAIAYSFVVFPSGRAYVGRGWFKAGGHTYGYNSISHAICFAGNFETQEPTAAALATARKLIAEGKSKDALTKDVKILGHRDADGAATACPGAHLYRRLYELRGGGGVKKEYVVKGKTFGRIRGAIRRVKNFLRKSSPGDDVTVKVRRRK